MADNRILFLNSAVFVGGLSNLLILGRWLDRIGSRPFLIAAGLFFVGLATTWTLSSIGIIPLSTGLVLALMFTLGLSSSAINLSGTRLAMAIIPETGRSHYFAVYSVFTNVVLGLSPMIWGVLVDQINAGSLFPNQMQFPFAFVFGGVGFFFVLTFLAAVRLDEPESVSLDRMLRNALSASRARFWIRLWPR